MIQKRGNRWRVVVQMERDPVTGKRRQLSGSAKSEREAVKLERQLRLQAEKGIFEHITVSQLVDEWWASGPRLAPTTRVNYRTNLDLHILPVLGARRVAEIRPRLVAAFLDHLRDEKQLSGGTVRKVRTVLSAAMSFAVAMEYAESNPVMKVPPPELEAKERVAPTVEETARILLAAERHDPSFLTYLWVAAEEGGRRGETLALRWGGIDFDRSAVTIDQTITVGEDGAQVRPRTKTRKPRTIAVSTSTLELLARERDRVEALLSAAAGTPTSVEPGGLVFSGGLGSRRTVFDGEPWRPDSTTRRFRKLKQLAGVRTDIDLHGLRHTMVTELLAAGVDPRTVMARAGHSSEATTMQIYAKVRPTIDASAAELWGRILNDKLDELRAADGADVAVGEPGASVRS